MTQEELNRIPEVELITYIRKGKMVIPKIEKISVRHFDGDEPIAVTDVNGQRWNFATRESDGAKVKIKANAL